MNEKEAIDILHNGEKMNLTTLLRTFKREGIENFIVTKKEVIEPILNLIEKQQAEIEKKDKVIHLMAEEIASYNHYEALGKLEDKDCVKQYFNQKIEKGE